MTTDSPAPAAPRRDGSLHFPLQENERVLEICRRHWFYLWPRTILYTLAALVPIIVVGVAITEWFDYSGMTARVFWIASLVYVLYWLVRIFLNWYRYQNDIWVITNQRIVDSTKTTPFTLKISTADLVNVQDMTVERDGVLRTMFNYGDVICQTAAEQQEFRMSAIPHPQDVQLLVDKERDRERLRGRPSG
jgi:membrane protein YdbS with pleckstrin-like domain